MGTRSAEQSPSSARSGEGQRQTISLDLDGVIIQNPFYKGVLPRIRAHLREAPGLSGLEPEEALRRINDAISEEWKARMARGEFVSAYDWDSIYGAVALSLGAAPVPDVAGIVEECCGQEGMIALLPGAREGLEALRDAGFRLAAATNGYHPYQWPVLEALGIAELFDTVLSPDRVGFAKPDARFFAGVPGLVAHVGDTLEHDVLGARRAGVVSVWLAAELPESLRAVPLDERVGRPEFEPFLEESLEKALYRHFHGDARAEEYRPDYVVWGAGEFVRLAEVLLARCG
ncbi:MAG TPA: HAD family hydrolase [Trueperaceae bacterium]